MNPRLASNQLAAIAILLAFPSVAFCLGTEFENLRGWQIVTGSAEVVEGVFVLSPDPTKGFGEARAYMTLDTNQFPIMEMGCTGGECRVYLADVYGVKEEPKYIRIGNKVTQGPARFYLEDLTNWDGRYNAVLAIQTRSSVSIDYIRFIAQGETEAKVHPIRPVPRYEVCRALGAVTVDGKLDEPSWQKCKPMGEFRLTDGMLLANSKTTARMVWDADNLYVGVHCEDKDLFATKTDRDDDLWEEDAIELFVTVPNMPKYFVEFEVSPLGTVMDIFNLRPYRGVVNWDCRGWKAAVSMDGTTEERGDEDSSWTVELAIPLLSVYAQPFLPDRAKKKEAVWQVRKVKKPDEPEVAFNFRPKPGTVWRVNLFRIDYEKSHAEYHAWSPPVHQGFHTTDRFGEIIFSGKKAGE